MNVQPDVARRRWRRRRAGRIEMPAVLILFVILVRVIHVIRLAVGRQLVLLLLEWVLLLLLLLHLLFTENLLLEPIIELFVRSGSLLLGFVAARLPRFSLPLLLLAWISAIRAVRMGDWRWRRIPRRPVWVKAVRFGTSVTKTFARRIIRRWRSRTGACKWTSVHVTIFLTAAVGKVRRNAAATTVHLLTRTGWRMRRCHVRTETANLDLLHRLRTGPRSETVGRLAVGRKSVDNRSWWMETALLKWVKVESRRIVSVRLVASCPLVLNFRATAINDSRLSYWSPVGIRSVSTLPIGCCCRDAVGCHSCRCWRSGRRLSCSGRVARIVGTLTCCPAFSLLTRNLCDTIIEREKG